MLERHSGGIIDWYSVDADAPLPAPEPLPEPTTVYPGRMRYPGAPLPRWWQIEEAHVDIGGFPPDRSHFATMLLIDLLVSHSDDWFVFPLVTPAGHAVTLHEVRIRDAFGDEWTVQPPADWSLLHLAPSGRTLHCLLTPPGLPARAVSWTLLHPRPLQLLEGSLGTDHTAHA